MKKQTKPKNQAARKITISNKTQMAMPKELDIRIGEQDGK
jgi:hypothetical protein